MHVVVNTDTEYEKKDSNNHFGLKCQVVGYEWTSDPSEVSPPLSDKAKKSFLIKYRLCTHVSCSQCSDPCLAKPLHHSDVILHYIRTMSSSAVFVVSGEGAGQSGGHVRSLSAEGGHSATFCRYVCV